MIRIVVLIGLVALAASGCASQPCQGSLAYQHAHTTPPLKAPPGLQVPKPDSTYQIPSVQGKKQSFVYKVPAPQDPKKKVTRCLETPPPLPSHKGGGVPSRAPKPQV